jgi:hypothetical protein
VTYFNKLSQYLPGDGKENNGRIQLGWAKLGKVKLDDKWKRSVPSEP